MLTTVIYILGAVSLQHTDMNSESIFYSFLLPSFNLFFVIFIVWQFIFFFSLNTFSRSEDSGISQLLKKFWNLNYEIREKGAIRGSTTSLFHLIDTLCFFIALRYYFNWFLGFI